MYNAFVGSYAAYIVSYDAYVNLLDAYTNLPGRAEGGDRQAGDFAYVEIFLRNTPD